MNDDLKNSLSVLKKGGLLLYPTDTVWGIGCDATNYDAVQKIFDLKKREDSKTEEKKLNLEWFLAFSGIVDANIYTIFEPSTV